MLETIADETGFNENFRVLAVLAALNFEGFYEENRHGYDPAFYDYGRPGGDKEPWRQHVKFINEYYDEYGRVPTLPQINAKLLDQLPVDPLPEHVLPWMRVELRKYAQHQVFSKGLNDSAEHMVNLDFDRILPAIEKAADLDVGEGLEVLNLLADRDEILKRIRQKSDSMVPTGWTALDDRFGGWEPGTISAMAARTGTGKTIWLCNAALNLARAGKNVLVLSLEMPGADIGGRAMRMLTGRKAHGRMGAHEFLELRQALDKADMDVMRRLNIATMTAPSASQIAAEYRRLKRKGHAFDAVVMDYMDLCEPDESKAKANEIWLADKAMTWEMKLFAEREGIVFLTAFQTNRNIDNRKPGDEYTANMVAGGSEKSRAATNLMFLERMDNDAEIRRAVKERETKPETEIPEREVTGYKVFYTKIRNGVSGGWTEFGWDAEHMLITDSRPLRNPEKVYADKSGMFEDETPTPERQSVKQATRKLLDKGSGKRKRKGN